MSRAASVDRDALTLGLLDAPAVRIGIVLPLVVAVVDVVVRSRIVEPWWFAGVVAVATVLALGGTVRSWRWIADEGLAHRMARIWQGMSATLGVALIAPFLVVAVDVEVERFAPLIAIVVVSGAYSYASRWRAALSSWTVVVWLVTLWWAGIRDPAVLALHLGGGAALVLASVRLGAGLARSLEEAALERARSEDREALLTSVLRINTLDPDDVLRAVAGGFVAVGFDVVAIREVDEEAGTATTLAGQVTVMDPPPARVLPLDRGLVGAAVRGRRTLVVDVATATDEQVAELGRYGVRGAYVEPLYGPAGEVVAVAAAGTTHGLSDRDVDAARLLAEQASRALVRAQEYRADRIAVEELRQLDVATQDFVSTVSHELRTPLTVVQGLGQTLLTRWDDLTAERRADLLRRVAANADRLAAMVRSLLDSSALERGQLDPQVERVELAPLLDDLVHRLPVLTARYPTRIEVAEDLAVRADPDLLEHVIENLLTNVGKHTPVGTPVTIRARRAGAEVVVEVHDDGPGIAPEDLPHVLERFYRGVRSRAEAGGGLGLGLALAQQIVQAHGGRLTVRSAPGRGTTFSFRLPAG